MLDTGFRRYLPFSLDFDTRSETLALPVTNEWVESAKINHENTVRKFKEELIFEYGIDRNHQKIEDFIKLGRLPFSIVSYHNVFHRQARNAFISGCYYPSLTGACALGERILNHLVLDLRQFYTEKPTFKHFAKKKSVDDWDQAIIALKEWGVLLDDVAEEFRKLKKLRNSSIHFNTKTYESVRNDALAAFDCLRIIIGQQFGSFGSQPWMISGTKGHCFIKKNYEENPFVKTYFLPQCPYVGFRFAMRIDRLQPPSYFDIRNYGEGSISDDNFTKLFNERSRDQMVNPDLGHWEPFQGAKVWVQIEPESGTA